MGAHNIIPEFECFDTGIVRSVGLFADKGMIKPPVHVSFVMGIASGMPADPELLPIIIRQLRPETRFQTIVIGREDVWPVHRRALELGGERREVAVLFLAHDVNSNNAGPLTCPIPPAIANASGGSVKVTFVVAVEECDQPVSVVGDFNGWDPGAAPMTAMSVWMAVIAWSPSPSAG